MFLNLSDLKHFKNVIYSWFKALPINALVVMDVSTYEKQEQCFWKQKYENVTENIRRKFHSHEDAWLLMDFSCDTQEIE